MPTSDPHDGHTTEPVVLRRNTLRSYTVDEHGPRRLAPVTFQRAMWSSNTEARDEANDHSRQDHLLAHHRRRVRSDGVQRRQLQLERAVGTDERRLRASPIPRLFPNRADG